VNAAERPTASPEPLSDFVYQVLCVRARRDLAPLDAPSMRGLLQRNGLRPADLLAIARKPLDVLNLDDGDERANGQISALFTEAVVRHGEPLKLEARARYVARIAEVIRALHGRTPYRFTAPDDRAPLMVHVQIAFAAGLPLEPEPVHALLRRALVPPAPLPPWTPAPPPSVPRPAPTSPPRLRVAPPPVPVASAADVDGLVLGAVLELACVSRPTQLPTWHDAPWPHVTLTPCPPPALGLNLPILIPETRDFLAEAMLTPEGTPVWRWRSVAAPISGVVGGGVGLVLLLEALVDRNLWLGVAGGATLVVGIGLDLVFGWWAKRR